MSAAECWWERQYDRLKAENADLEAENVKLRELILDAADMMGENEKLRELAEQLRQQLADATKSMGRVEERYAKLRELVRDYDKMLGLVLADYRGFDAPLSDATHITLRMRMHNLGIEVD